MNNYFDYLDMDSEYAKAYPNDNIYNKSVTQNKYPSKLLNIQKLQNLQNMQNQDKNTMDNMMNFNNNNNCGLLNDTEGTLRGNMFPDLYDPYKNEGQKRFVPTSERERQLFEIQKTAFAMKDINLYLDVHPENTCMINLYNRYLNQNKQQLKNFEAQYGPITLKSDNLNSVPWAWNKTKWPWEGGN